MNGSATPHDRAAAAGPSRQRILVVDDDQDGAELVAEALAAAGEVRVAFDGGAALALLDAFVPDLALLDLSLPVMDGYELARRIRAIVPAVRLVAISGYGRESDRCRSIGAGFAEHLVKPLDLARLRAIAAGDGS